MRLDSRITRDLAVSTDIFNTLTGGVINPHYRLERKDSHLKMHVHLPSVKTNDIFVEINENTLIIRYYLKFKANLQPMRIPVTAYNRPLPYFIDVTRVSAAIEDGHLVVIMPFNALANGFSRQLNIAS